MLMAQEEPELEAVEPLAAVETELAELLFEAELDSVVVLELEDELEPLEVLAEELEPVEALAEELELTEPEPPGMVSWSPG